MFTDYSDSNLLGVSFSSLDLSVLGSLLSNEVLSSGVPVRGLGLNSGIGDQIRVSSVVDDSLVGSSLGDLLSSLLLIDLRSLLSDLTSLSQSSVLSSWIEVKKKKKGGR